jgi:hypothetical protein
MKNKEGGGEERWKVCLGRWVGCSDQVQPDHLRRSGDVRFPSGPHLAQPATILREAAQLVP